MHKKQQGFTLMEIIVATTIFAVVSVAMLALFNYTLKINRRSEALRQATQGMRSFVELLVKEIHNGQIDYATVNGTTPRGFAIGPCSDGVVVAGVVSNYYALKDNRLGLINVDSEEECLYYGDANGNYVSANNFANSNGTIVLQKQSGTKEILVPPNFTVENLMFLIRPLCDPYATCTNPYPPPLIGYPKVQPSVTIFAKFVAKLPTGEQVPIYYQTSVSSSKYDIPNQ